jgi:alanine-glyoxylate transaminase/serine-glyoxylate transaminase/serine-pyruvate transaminase
MIKELNPKARFLMGPGPSDVHSRVYKAMSTPMLGHLDPQFIQIMDEVMEMTRSVYQTKNEITSVISATGTSGMETCLVNLLEPGDTAVVCVSGVFSGRIADIAGRCGATVVRVDAPWGTSVDPAQVKDALKNCKPKLVAMVHAETSTGVLQPLEEIGRLAHEAGALFMVDAVTSLGGTVLKVDDWGIDAIYSCTQKCLSAPPGLSPVSFSSKALEVMDSRKTKIQSFYLDLTLLRKYWTGAKRAYHHTAPISMFYAAHEALRMVHEEGLEARIKRHKQNHEILRDGLESLGFEFLVAPQFRIPMLNAVKIPAGYDDVAVRTRLLNEYNIEIGAGLGDFAGKIWRIGLMGESCTINHIHLLLSALKQIIK